MHSEADPLALLTYREVGQLLGLGERAALNWVKEHNLPVNPGRPARVSRADVIALAALLGRPLSGTSEEFGISARPASEADGSAEPIEAAYRVADEAAAEVALVPLATMVEELRGLADQLAELARRNEGLALEVGTLRERQAGHEAERLAHVGEITTREQTISTQAETIAELRRRAEEAEAESARRHEEEVRAAELLRRRNEQEWLNRERMQAAPAAPGAPEASAATDPSGAASPGFWARVRRVFGGV